MYNTLIIERLFTDTRVCSSASGCWNWIDAVSSISSGKFDSRYKLFAGNPNRYNTKQVRIKHGACPNPFAGSDGIDNWIVNWLSLIRRDFQLFSSFPNLNLFKIIVKHHIFDLYSVVSLDNEVILFCQIGVNYFLLQKYCCCDVIFWFTSVSYTPPVQWLLVDKFLVHSSISPRLSNWSLPCPFFISCLGNWIYEIMFYKPPSFPFADYFAVPDR